MSRRGFGRAAGLRGGCRRRLDGGFGRGLLGGDRVRRVRGEHTGEPSRRGRPCRRRRHGPDEGSSECRGPHRGPDPVCPEHVPGLPDDRWWHPRAPRRRPCCPTESRLGAQVPVDHGFGELISATNGGLSSTGAQGEGRHPQPSREGCAAALGAAGWGRGPGMRLGPRSTRWTMGGQRMGDEVNVVQLVGRVSAVGESREPPSGDVVVMVRVVVPRPPRRARGATVDTIDVACWSVRARRRASRCTVGDEVEVEGSLRRRFFRAGGGVASRYEVEASAVKRRPAR